MADSGAQDTGTANVSPVPSFVAASGFQFGDADRKTVRLKIRQPKDRVVDARDDGGSDGRHVEGRGRGLEDDTEDGGVTDHTSSSPIIPSIDEKTLALFPTGRPRETGLDTVICKHCKKPVLRLSALEHVRGCLRAKQEKQRKKKEARDAANKLKYGDKDKEKEAKAGKSGANGNAADDDEDGDVPPANGPAKAANKKSATEDAKKGGKKRKADADDDKDAGATATAAPSAGKDSPVATGAAAGSTAATGGASTTGAASGGSSTVKKKKKKEEPKKVPKFKGPVDVEKQCGVQLPNGGQCARSLTCKSHSMGAKRAVPGRSLPYDMLLQAYQKRNQARQQKAAIDANAPVANEENGSGKVDSDDEKDECMAAINRLWSNREAGRLVDHHLIDTRSKYKMFRIRNMFMAAMGGPPPSEFVATTAPSMYAPNGTPSPFGGNNAFPAVLGPRLQHFNFFGPDTFTEEEEQQQHQRQQQQQQPQPQALQGSRQLTGHLHGPPNSSANTRPTPGSTGPSRGQARPSPSATTAAVGVGSASGGSNGPSWKRHGSLSMSQQAQVNAASASASKKVAAHG
ncbi:hypothetical protein KEM52_004374 [Ascosphaera acerosa]|nr:hypothetical protein KEM52_004374 [Ascosphaera acerosa]